MFYEGEPGERGFKVKIKYSWLTTEDERDDDCEKGEKEIEKDDMKWLKDLYDIHSRKKREKYELLSLLK